MSIQTISRPAHLDDTGQVLPLLEQWDLVRAITVLETDPYFADLAFDAQPAAADDDPAGAFAAGLEELLATGRI